MSDTELNIVIPPTTTVAVPTPLRHTTNYQATARVKGGQGGCTSYRSG